MTPNFGGLVSGLILLGIVIGFTIWSVVCGLIWIFSDHKPKQIITHQKPVITITTVTVNGATKTDTTYIYPTNK
jgi:hypothetical protein